MKRNLDVCGQVGPTNLRGSPIHPEIDRALNRFREVQTKSDSPSSVSNFSHFVGVGKAILVASKKFENRFLGHPLRQRACSLMFMFKYLRSIQPKRDMRSTPLKMQFEFHRGKPRCQEESSYAHCAGLCVTVAGWLGGGGNTSFPHTIWDKPSFVVLKKQTIICVRAQATNVFAWGKNCSRNACKQNCPSDLDATRNGERVVCAGSRIFCPPPLPTHPCPPLCVVSMFGRKGLILQGLISLSAVFFKQRLRGPFHFCYKPVQPTVLLQFLARLPGGSRGNDHVLRQRVPLQCVRRE